MKSTSFSLSTLEQLEAALENLEAEAPGWRPSATLVQVFSSNTDADWLRTLALGLHAALPEAALAGVTTIGEIYRGQSVANTTVVSVTWFRSTQLMELAFECQPGQARQCGLSLGQALAEISAPVAGLLLLATPLTLDMSALLSGLGEAGGATPVFGGGAGVYSHDQDSAVFTAGRVINSGLVAVAFCGSELFIEAQTYLGWVPLSKAMTITATDGMMVKTIDGQPAYEVYNRYLDIAADEQFFYNVLEFPLLVQRANDLMARIPVKVSDTGGLEFIADIHEGEVVQIGYGHLGQILNNASHILNKMTEHQAESIFLYSCGCRRFLMQEDVNLETQPFEKIASTNGFYTYGEFFGSTKKAELLNATLVAVAMTEGKSALASNPSAEQPTTAFVSQDPYAHKHTRVISRLTHFISAVTEELNQAHVDAHRIAITDDLTGLPNRRRMQELLIAEMNRTQRYGGAFSVALIDVDHFKEVNDAYGHQVGDRVLQELSGALTRLLRKADIVGRWGGEEFLILFPKNDATEAAKIAEKLRVALALEDFSIVGKKSVSFGITGFSSGDSISTLLARADQALYKAKKLGRNCVCVVRAAVDLI